MWDRPPGREEVYIGENRRFPEERAFAVLKDGKVFILMLQLETKNTLFVELRNFYWDAAIIK